MWHEMIWWNNAASACVCLYVCEWVYCTGQSGYPGWRYSGPRSHAVGHSNEFFIGLFSHSGYLYKFFSFASFMLLLLLFFFRFFAQFPWPVWPCLGSGHAGQFPWLDNTIFLLPAMPQRDFIYRKVHVGSAWHLPYGGGGGASLLAPVAPVRGAWWRRRVECVPRLLPLITKPHSKLTWGRYPSSLAYFHMAQLPLSLSLSICLFLLPEMCISILQHLAGICCFYSHFWCVSHPTYYNYRWLAKGCSRTVCRTFCLVRF